MTGRNNKIRKRLGATAFFVLLAGAALVVAAPASALNLVGSGAGSADALWGAYGDLTQPEGEVEQDAAGHGHTEAEASSAAELNPPDPQPVIDQATGVVMEAKAQAEATAALLMAQQGSLAAAGAAQWGVYGGSDGDYDVVLGGDYDAGSHGTAAATGSKGIKQDLQTGAAANGANEGVAEAEAAANGVLEQIEAAWSQLHGSLYLGLDGAAKALGSVGFEIAGVFGLNKAVDASMLDQTHLGQQIDFAAPALPDLKADLPEVAVPAVALDQSGAIGADAAAVAGGIVRAP